MPHSPPFIPDILIFFFGNVRVISGNGRIRFDFVWEYIAPVAARGTHLEITQKESEENALQQRLRRKKKTVYADCGFKCKELRLDYIYSDAEVNCFSGNLEIAQKETERLSTGAVEGETDKKNSSM